MLRDLAGQWAAELGGFLVLPEIPGVAEWLVEQAIPIGMENTTFKGGNYDFARFPVISTLLCDFFADERARELFMLKPVQSTFTTTATFCMAHDLVFRGGNIIFVLHDRDAAREKVRDEVAPLFRKVEALGKSEEEAENDSTVGVIRFGCGTVRVGSGGTKSTLTAFPAKIVFLDECELHPLIDGAHSINRARERLTGAEGGGKLLAGSKPEKEAIVEKDDKTKRWRVVSRDGAHLHANYLSGSQLRYECQCPHCEGHVEPKFEHIKFAHLNEAAAGEPVRYDFDKFEDGVFWQCPRCEGRVHEGAEKEAWVRAGRWVQTPADERAAKEVYPRGVPGRWSAQFSALTDISFVSLKWGRICIKFLEAQNDPVALRAFRNGILGQPEPLIKAEDTTRAQIRALIAKPHDAGVKLPNHVVPAYRMRDDDGKCAFRLPMMFEQVAFVGLCADTQDREWKFTVRAHGRDGTMPLLDYGAMAWTKDGEELTHYLDTAKFTTMDGVEMGIAIAYVDVRGHHWSDMLELSLRHSKIECVAGVGDQRVLQRRAGLTWIAEANKKGGGGIIQYWMTSTNEFEDRLYLECIQGFDPSRYRLHAPAMWLPLDVGEDFLDEHLSAIRTIHKGQIQWTRGNGKNDFGDCSKLHLVLDWNRRLKAINMKTGNERQRAIEAQSAATPVPATVQERRAMAPARKRPRIVIVR